MLAVGQAGQNTGKIRKSCRLGRKRKAADDKVERCESQRRDKLQPITRRV